MKGQIHRIIKKQASGWSGGGGEGICSQSPHHVTLVMCNNEQIKSKETDSLVFASTLSEAQKVL